MTEILVSRYNRVGKTAGFQPLHTVENNPGRNPLQIAPARPAVALSRLRINDHNNDDPRAHAPTWSACALYLLASWKNSTFVAAPALSTCAAFAARTQNLRLGSTKYQT